MIINRAFFREVVQTSLVVTAIFISLYVVISLVNLLAKAAGGDLPVQVIFALLGLQTVRNLSVILPLAMFVGILFTLSRWYRDSEMTVLGACGIGLTNFLRPAWVLAIAFAVLVSLLAFYFAPLATAVMNRIKHENTEVYQAGVTAGEFHRSKRDGSIFYVESVERDGRLRNIFANTAQFGRRGVLVARSGYHYEEARSGDQFLVLENGTRYEGIPGKADYKILQYESYAIRMEPVSIGERAPSLHEISTRELLRAPDHHLAVELQWRLAKPLALFILAPLALVFAYTDARRGRFANLFTAMMVYFLYANLLGFAHALLKQDRMPLEIGFWWVHGLFALLAFYFLWRRSGHKPLLPAWVRSA